jgi:predicted phage terminase large subunit-like protein
LPDHELRKKIDWYLDADGYPDPKRDGVKRYFIVEGGDWIWADTQQELAEKYNIPEEKWEGKILSFAFVSGTIYDNPIMMEKNPSYVAFLEGLNDVDKAQLLHGNWDARPKGASYWERDWLMSTTSDKVPSNMSEARAWDLAATERSQAVKFPDPTACIKMYKSKQGFYYLAGDFHEDIEDDHYNIKGQFCKRSGDRDMHIVKQATHDGRNCPIVLPVDPGAAGKTAYQEMAKFFISEGFRVKKDPAATNKSKLTRFQPFASACENSLVYVIEDTFDPVTRDFIYKQLEAFDGERSTSSRKDDFVDAIATAFNYLAEAKVHTGFTMPKGLTSRNTALVNHRKTVR